MKRSKGSSGQAHRLGKGSFPYFLYLLSVLSFLCFFLPPSALAQGKEKPKVRAVTAFVNISRENYAAELADALALLRRAKAAIEQGGYEVQTVRVVTQPFPEYTRGLPRAEAVAFIQQLTALAAKENFLLNIGPAVLRATDDVAALDLLTEILCRPSPPDASAVIASADGLHANAIHASARLIKRVSECSPRSQGTFSFAATAMLLPYAPFFPGGYHHGSGHFFSIGLQAANVVDEIFAAARSQSGDPRAWALEELTRAFELHGQALERVARAVEKDSGWIYQGLDATPAPLKDASIGAAIEKFTGAPFGSSGTLDAARLITTALENVRRRFRFRTVGYMGLMLPVLEDSVIAQRWSEGRLSLDSLLAYSAVCGTGLDTVPLPGDVSEEQLARILGDVAALALKWNKPLTARLQPVAGKKAGELTAFDDPFLVNAVLQKLP
ncbi:MAG TPA: DUF711 family protein [Candidatus Nitrosotenuis sp.]|nr:DUF711 family protein [Candidatus Nitrosotenuis sp.]